MAIMFDIDCFIFYCNYIMLHHIDARELRIINCFCGVEVSGYG
jgi:hypothetical protein